MITDKITREKFRSIAFKNYIFAHRHIGRKKDYLEVSLWQGQNLRTSFAVECHSTKQDYISACKTIWKDLRKKHVNFDYMEEAKKKRERERYSEDYSLGGPVRDCIGRIRY